MRTWRLLMQLGAVGLALWLLHSAGAPRRLVPVDLLLGPRKVQTQGVTP